MSEGCPIDDRTGMPYRAASFHPFPLSDDVRRCRGDFESLGAQPPGVTWWADRQLVVDTILDHQGVPADARRVLLAMVGAALFDIGEQLPHPTIPGRTMTNKLEVILFIWGRAGVGKSTILNMIAGMYNDNTDLVGTLENQSDESFGLDKIKHAFVVIAQDIDSKFNLSPTQLTGMTSGAPQSPSESSSSSALRRNAVWMHVRHSAMSGPGRYVYDVVTSDTDKHRPLHPHWLQNSRRVTTWWGQSPGSMHAMCVPIFIPLSVRPHVRTCPQARRSSSAPSSSRTSSCRTGGPCSAWPATRASPPGSRPTPATASPGAPSPTASARRCWSTTARCWSACGGRCPSSSGSAAGPSRYT